MSWFIFLFPLVKQKMYRQAGYLENIISLTNKKYEMSGIGINVTDIRITLHLHLNLLHAQLHDFILKHRGKKYVHEADISFFSRQHNSSFRLFCKTDSSKTN